jgi:hypothetical protein
VGNISRIIFEFKWWKGLKVEGENNWFLNICIGASLLIASIGGTSYLIIKAIAPHGFF